MTLGGESQPVAKRADSQGKEVSLCREMGRSPGPRCCCRGARGSLKERPHPHLRRWAPAGPGVNSGFAFYLPSCVCY